MWRSAGALDASAFLLRRRFLPRPGPLPYTARLMSETADPSASGFDVRYIAHLARLHLDPAETATLQGQLEHILRYVEELKQVDVSGVVPMATSITTSHPLRPDGVRPGLDHDTALAHAPAHRQGQFQVPPILD